MSESNEHLKDPLNDPFACPDPDTLLQALAEGCAPGLLDHVSTCARCGSDPALQDVLTSWRQLDTLPGITVSDNFEARLRARLLREASRQRRWYLLDLIFDLLHTPALVAAMGMCFWLPVPEQQLSRPRLERQSFSERPQLRQDLAALDALEQLQQLYQHRQVQK